MNTFKTPAKSPQIILCQDFQDGFHIKRHRRYFSMCTTSLLTSHDCQAPIYLAAGREDSDFFSAEIPAQSALRGVSSRKPVTGGLMKLVAVRLAPDCLGPVRESEAVDAADRVPPGPPEQGLVRDGRADLVPLRGVMGTASLAVVLGSGASGASPGGAARRPVALVPEQHEHRTVRLEGAGPFRGALPHRLRILLRRAGERPKHSAGRGAVFSAESAAALFAGRVFRLGGGRTAC